MPSWPHGSDDVARESQDKQCLVVRPAGHLTVGVVGALAAAAPAYQGSQDQGEDGRQNSSPDGDRTKGVPRRSDLDELVLVRVVLPVVESVAHVDIVAAATG